MEIKEIMKYIDHTLLKPTASWEDIQALCEEALEYHMASVCIPPCYIEPVYQKYGNSLNICTVIGFPLGYSTTAAKVYEAEDAVRKGADEIDMVINLTDIKNGEFSKVKNEIALIKNAVGNKVLKVIVETCYLTKEEKVELCRIVTEAGADFIKTSTGFGTAGACLEDIALFKEFIGKNVKIKAAGGIRTKDEMEEYIQTGCSRIGSSSAGKIFQNQG